MHPENKTEFITYRRFKTIFDAAPLVENLRAAGIEFEIENASPSLDITFSANDSQNEYRVKVSPGDFEKIDALLQTDAAEIMNKIDSDYYLFSFSDEELVEILEKPDEWSSEDHFIASKILNDRGKPLTEEQIELMRQKRIAFLKKSSPKPKGLITAGWIQVFAGGLFGIIIGWYLKEFRKTLFNGERVWEYDEPTRLKGARMMKTGLFVHVLLLFAYLFYLTSRFM